MKKQPAPDRTKPLWELFLTTNQGEFRDEIPSPQAANWEAGISIDGLALPRRIGVCINYGAHIWYQLQSATERDLAAQLGISLEAVDANMDAPGRASRSNNFSARESTS